MSYDVGIIGGGAIGLACAWRLAQGGARVVLFERGQVGREASWAAGGMLAAQCEMAHHPPTAHYPPHTSTQTLLSTHTSYGQARAMFDLCLQSRALYGDFADELFELTGVDVELSLASYAKNDWRKPGIMFVGNEASLKALDAQQQSGARVENAAKSLWRWLPDEGQVEPRLLLEALQKAVKKSAIALYAGCAVHSLNSVRGIFYIATDAGSFHCEKVLLTAGAWSGDLSTHIQPPLPALPVRPVAGQMLALRPRNPRVLPHIIYSADAYLIPRRDGRVVVGATMEERGFEAQNTREGVAKLKARASELAPQLADAEMEEAWAGLRPATPDGLPILGRTNIENLFVAGGHFRNGILLTPATAQHMTQCILQNAPIAAEFQAARFSPNFQETTEVAAESFTPCVSN